MAKAKTVKETTKESESTALVVLTPEEQAYLDSVKPQGQGGPTGPARLQINVNSKDENGVKRIIGSWNIRGTDKYFDGEIKFRPIRYANKLIRYVEENGAWKIAGESIYFRDFSEQIHDTLGGQALGRLFGRAYTDEQKLAAKKNADVYLDIFGLVQLGDNEEWEPVLYRVRGSKMKKMLDAFKAIPKDKAFSEYAYTLETFQPTGKQYWDINVSPDLSQRLRISDIISLDKDIATFITESNRQIMTQHMRQSTNPVGDRFMKASDNAKIIDVEAEELDDELPF